MSLHNGTAAETERKRMLENEGHIILNLQVMVMSAGIAVPFWHR